MGKSSTSIKKGEVRNPTGRPRKSNSMTEILNQCLEEVEMDYKGEKVNGKKMVSLKIISLAFSGDLAALKYCYDRIDGTPTQAIRHVDANGADVKGEIDVTKLTREQQEALALIKPDD